MSQKVDGKIIFTGYWKVLVFELFGEGKYGFLSQEVYRKDDIYLLRKSSCFELFGGGKYGLFWAKKLMERWYLLVLRSSCFELFGDGKYNLFLGLKVDGKMIFTWSFWAFHDIPGPAVGELILPRFKHSPSLNYPVK